MIEAFLATVPKVSWISSRLILQSFIKGMGLQINTSKTMSIDTQVVFQVNNVKLPRVDRFKYLGGYVSRNCMMNEENHVKIQSASCVLCCRNKKAYTRLKARLHSDIALHNISPFEPLIGGYN